METRSGRSALLTVPAIGVALMPKLICPLCWPAYAGNPVFRWTRIPDLRNVFAAIHDSLFDPGAWNVSIPRQTTPAVHSADIGHRGFSYVVTGKFYLERDALMYGGITVLVVAAVWNAWPPAVVESCSCNPNERR